MDTPSCKAIACKIYKGMIPSERYFELSLPGGEKYESYAASYHFWNSAGHKITRHEPACSEPIDGLVAVRIVETAGENRLVAWLPDDEKIVIEANRVVERPSEVGIEVEV